MNVKSVGYSSQFTRSLKGVAKPPVIALFVIAVGMALSTGRFLTLGNLRDVAWEASVIAIMAVGSTIVIFTGGIDLSPGAILAVVSMVMSSLIVVDHMSLVAAVILALLLGVGLGLINGILVVGARVAPFIATLGTMTAYQGIAYLFNGSSPYFNVSNSLGSVFYGRLLFIPLPIVYIIVLYVLAWWVMRHTVIGRSTYAVGGNPEAARLAGLKVRSTLLFAYAIAGLCAAFAGVLMTAQLNSGSADYGTSGLELQAIAAAVIGGASLMGGTGSVPFTLAGSLILTVIQNGLDLHNVPSTWQSIALGVIIVVAVGIDGWRNEFAGLGRLLRPHGGSSGLHTPQTAARPGAEIGAGGSGLGGGGANGQQVSARSDGGGTQASAEGAGDQ